jgi:hypothetical protein
VTVVAGDTTLARPNYLYYETHRVEANMRVPTPPRIGRQSKFDGETERRSSQVMGTAELRDAIGQARHATRFGGSPGARRA